MGIRESSMSKSPSFTKNAWNKGTHNNAEAKKLAADLKIEVRNKRLHKQQDFIIIINDYKPNFQVPLSI